MTVVPPAAMVLAAGRGERMLPLTLSRAKPSLPVLGVSLLGRTLAALRAAGVRRFAVNAHHGVESVRDCLEREAPPDSEVRLFAEPVLQGTGGALAAPREFLSTEPLFLLQNSDTLVAPPVADLISRCSSDPNCLGALLVRRPALAGYRPIRVADGRVTGFSAARDDPAAATYLGVAAFRRELLAGVTEEGPRELFPDLVAPLLAQGWSLAALPWSGAWLEFTDPERYLQQVLLHVGQTEPTLLPGGEAAVRQRGAARLTAAGAATIDAGARLDGRIVVEAGSRIAARAELKDCLLLEDCEIGAARLERVVVADGCRIPDGASWKAGVIHRGDGEADFTPFPRTDRRGNG